MSSKSSRKIRVVVEDRLCRGTESTDPCCVHAGSADTHSNYRSPYLFLLPTPWTCQSAPRQPLSR